MRSLFLLLSVAQLLVFTCHGQDSLSIGHGAYAEHTEQDIKDSLSYLIHCGPCPAKDAAVCSEQNLPMFGNLARMTRMQNCFEITFPWNALKSSKRRRPHCVMMGRKKPLLHYGRCATRRIKAGACWRRKPVQGGGSSRPLRPSTLLLLIMVRI